MVRSVARDLETAYVHVTSRCNLRCTYCYMSAGEEQPGELSTSDMLSAIVDISSLSPRKIVLTGGEPLLRKDLLELAQTVRSTGPDVRLAVVTNGCFVTADIARNIVELFDDIRISIDGSAETHDSARGTGSHDMALRAFDLISSAGGHPGASVTVTSATLKDLWRSLEVLLGYGFRELHVSPVRLIGRADDINLACDLDELSTTLREFFGRTYGIEFAANESGRADCGLGSYLCLYPDGTAYPCHVLARPGFCIGNIRRKRASALLADLQLLRERRGPEVGDVGRLQACDERPRGQLTCLGVRAPGIVNLDVP